MLKTKFSFLIMLCLPLIIHAQQISGLGEYQGYSKPVYKGYKYSSSFIKTDDSLYLAADIFLPKQLPLKTKIPTILYLTRYVRSLQLKFPVNIFKDPVLADVSEDEIKFFTSYGYACIIVDARGTGASTGTRKMEFSQQEAKDGRNIINWITSQSWANGIIGTTGVSYVGTMAEMLLMNQLPQIKACIARSNIFDLYGYILFPGGIRQSPFIEIWKKLTNEMDNNDFSFAGKSSKYIRGVHAVNKDFKKLKQAISEHQKNFDIVKGMNGMMYRDDSLTGINEPLRNFSTYNLQNEISKSQTPIFRISGWYDGALSKSCIDGYNNTTNTKRVLLGPWDHGPTGNASPFAATTKLTFPIFTEMLRFFDHYLKGIDNGIDKEPLFNYFTIGEEKWKASNEWPPANTQMLKYYFSHDTTLQTDPSNTNSGKIKYQIDYTASSGNSSRWNSIASTYMNGPTHYTDRKEEDRKLICFQSGILEDTIIITGHPVINLTLSIPTTAIHIFCYLEDVSPDGKITYITEGLFNPLHKNIDSSNSVYKACYPAHSFNKKDFSSIKANEKFNITFDLLPVSYAVKKGHRIRVAIAGADKGHFDEPGYKPDYLNIHIGDKSFIEIPFTTN